MTTKYREDRFESQIKLYKLLIDKSKRLDIEGLCKIRLQNTVIAIARYSIKLEYKFAGENGKNVANENVHKICENATLREVLSEYDDHDIRVASRIINYMMKFKKYTLLRNVMSFKNLLNI